MTEVDETTVAAGMIEEAADEAVKVISKVDKTIRNVDGEISKVGRAISKPHKVISKLISTMTRADKILKIDNTKKTTMAVKTVMARKRKKGKARRRNKENNVVDKVMDKVIFGGITPLARLEARMVA